MTKHEVDSFASKLDKNFAKFIRKHSHEQQQEHPGGAEGEAEQQLHGSMAGAVHNQLLSEGAEGLPGDEDRDIDDGEQILENLTLND